MTYLKPEAVIEKKKEYLCPPSWGQFYRNPPHMVKGEMQYLIDEAGKRYVDFFAGVSVMNCGHCNPEILSKTIEQMQTLQHTSIIYLTEQMPLLAEKLSIVLPGELRRSFFCCTGSEANETALTMAKMYTGKNEIIALSSGLHGRTFMTMSATAIPMWRIDPSLAETVHFVPHPWEEGLSLMEAADKSLAAIEEVIRERGKDKIAALIIEPIQGNGGIIMPEASYFKRLKVLLESNDILMIVDEVQTGFARTGKMFACDHAGITPDLMCISKALTGGYMPMSIVCTTDKIYNAFYDDYNKGKQFMHSHTYAGNPLGCAAALAVLKQLEDENILEKAQEKAVYFHKILEDTFAEHPNVGEIRHIGLINAIELVEDKATKVPYPTDKRLGYEIYKKALPKGLLLRPLGNVIYFNPPLNIENEDLVKAVKIAKEAMDEVIKP